MDKAKRILTMVLMAILLMPNIALAGNEIESPSPQEPIPVTSMDKLLFIDNDNVYEKMDKAFKKGYYPAVKNGVATLVLPLMASESILQNQIRVTFNLGDPVFAPFQFKNYDKTVKLKNHSVNNGSGTADSFLVAIDMPLVDNPTMGRFPVIITATGRWADGLSFSQEFSLYVTISDGIDPGDASTLEPIPESEPIPEPEPVSTPETEEQPVPQAKILLNSFSVNPSPVVAGEEFRISATFRNTNESQSLDNVKITVTGETVDIVPVGDDTGSFYFKKIARQETITIDMKMKVAQNAKAEPHKIKFAVEYEGHKATAYTATEEAVIQVTQPVRLEFDEPQMPKEVNAGDTILVSMNVMNLGLSTIHNVRMLVEAQGLLPEKTAFLGNIESGAAQKGDLYAFVRTLNMTDSDAVQGKDRYGMTKGKVFLVYEDEYGQEYTEEFEFSTNINPPVILIDEELKEDEEPKNQSQWWISVIAVAGIIVAIANIRTYIKKQQERIRRQEDDDLAGHSQS
ncbi:hypothetical protein LQZ18_04715 [Lachnospiraceae bacterium ZAX-1]